MFDRHDLKWVGLTLFRGRRVLATVEPDPVWPELYRVYMGDYVSDMLNLPRAKEAAVCLSLANLNGPNSRELLSAMATIRLGEIELSPAAMPEQVERYAALMRGGEIFPPVLLETMPSGRYQIRDGAHRVAAARLNGHETIAAEILSDLIGSNAGRVARERNNDDSRKGAPSMRGKSRLGPSSIGASGGWE
jgi:ParB-like chromosome segregation protein Spo0J